LGVGDSDEVSLSTNILSFGSTDWMVPQTVSLVGQNDQIHDDNQTSEITFELDSADPNYNSGVSERSVSVITTDDDSAGFTISKSTAVVSEDGQITDSFTAVLDSQPTSDVVLSLSSEDSDEVSLSTGSLDFGSTDWMVPQTVFLTGIDDSDEDNDQTSVISFTLNSTDDNYDIGLSSKTVTVKTTDDDIIQQSCNPDNLVNQSSYEIACVTGRVIDATDASAISCASVCVGEQCTFTDRNGNYLINNLATDNLAATIVSNTADYTVYEENFQIQSAGQCSQENIAMSPVLESGQTRFVLSWDWIPVDFDSHLNFPDGAAQIFYGMPTNNGASLDLDNTQASHLRNDFEGRPETITINSLVSGSQKYEYYIKNFTERHSTVVTKTFSSANARAKIYKGSSVQTVTPPQGNGGYWHVLNMDSQGNIEIINQILSNEP
jgi:hypothetical protein